MYHGIAKAIESSRGFCSFPPRALAKKLGLPVLQSELLRSERFWEAAQPRPLQQNKTSSEAALKCFPRSETLIAAPRLALQGTTWNKPCKYPARRRGVPAGGCAGTAPSHVSRAKSSRTAPLPPSAAGGSPAPRHWPPPWATPIRSPFSRRLQSEVLWSRSLCL